MHRILFIALAAVVAGVAMAQNAAPRDPTSPGACVPPLEYRSAFAAYQRQSEQPLASWRPANEGVKPPAKSPAKPAAGAEQRGHQ